MAGCENVNGIDFSRYGFITILKTVRYAMNQIVTLSPAFLQVWYKIHFEQTKFHGFLFL